MTETTTRNNLDPQAIWLKETKKGGGLAPCPFCGVPRCQRSNYIRCSRCGLNWFHGEDLARDPRLSRKPPVVLIKPKEKAGEPPPGF